MKTLAEKLQNLQSLDIDKFENELTKINVAHNSKKDQKIIEDFSETMHKK